MKASTLAGALALAVAVMSPRESAAAPLNLAIVSCSKYENEVLATTPGAVTPGAPADPIDTVMWLFGFAVAKSGERAMYGDSLSAFGFGLDTECKNEPTSTLLEAVMAVRSKRINPMDLTQLDCATFEKRHVALRLSDPESARTLTMWLFGYAVGLSGGHILEPDLLAKFDSGLEAWCTKNPQDTVFDALSAPSPAIPRQPR